MAARQGAVATLATLMRALKTNINNSSSTINNLPNTPLPSLRRAFSLYDQINLIDNVPEDQLRFQGYIIRHICLSLFFFFFFIYSFAASYSLICCVVLIF